MPARLLLEVTIRVLGLWSLYLAISETVPVLGMAVAYSWTAGAPFFLQSLGQFAVQVILHGALGTMLIWWAPWIAVRFYPAGVNEAELHLRVGPGDVYHIACFVLGVYLLVHAAAPASAVVAAMMQGPWAMQGANIISQGVATLTCVATGIVLVFGAERIARLVANLRYDPDTIPRQQFSLRVLLAFLLLVAVVLGAIRILTIGVP